MEDFELKDDCYIKPFIELSGEKSMKIQISILNSPIIA